MSDFANKRALVKDWEKLALASIKAESLAGLERMDEDALPIKPLYTAKDIPEHISSISEKIGIQDWVIAQEIESQPDAEALKNAILEEIQGGVQQVEFSATQDVGFVAEVIAEIAAKNKKVQFSFAPNPDYAPDSVLNLSASENIIYGIDPVLTAFSGCGDAEGVAEHAIETWLKTEKNIAPFAIAGDEYHLMGLTPAAELATILGAAVFLLRQMEAAGIPPTKALPKIYFRFGATADLYYGIAKTRALAILLEKINAETKANDHTLRRRIHGITSTRHLSRLDPDSNILRNGTAMLALALGGAGRITCHPHDWLTGSSYQGLRLARHTHHLLAAEARLDSIADPAAGSFFIERRTDDIAIQAWEKFKEIEYEGGIIKAQDRIIEWGKAAAKNRLKEISNGNDLLGVTHHHGRNLQGFGQNGFGQNEFGGGLPPLLLMRKDTPRGGAHRPAAPWEELYQQYNGRAIRCLLIDIGDSNKAGAMQRWFRSAGVEATPLSVKDDKTAIAAIISAKPSITVIGGKSSNATQRTASGSGFFVDADIECDDKLALVKRILEEAAP